jgi:hypothetical protein
MASRQAHKVLEWALVGWRVRDSPADDAHIVLGELVTNTLTHSMDVFTLTLRLHGDQILIEVRDCADATPEVMLPDDLAVKEDAARLYDEGWSIRQVASRFECSYGAMRRILARRTALRDRGGAEKDRPDR